MGEAKRRAAWIAKGGKDWGTINFQHPSIVSRFVRWIVWGRQTYVRARRA